MKTQIEKLNGGFEPFKIVIEITTYIEASTLLHIIQREIPEHDELRIKFENELKRQNWSI